LSRVGASIFPTRKGERPMRNQFLCAGLVLAGALLLGSGLRADEPKKGEPSLEDYAKMSQPGPEHKKLDPLAVSWTYVGKMWMEPGKPPTESKGTSENKWILDGRFLSQEVQGEMMGMKFSGRGLTGFDKAQGKYVGVWVDSFGTGYSTSIGTGDQTGKVFTFTREEVDPVT